MSVVSKNIFDLLGDSTSSPAPAKSAAPAKKESTPAPQRSVPGSQPRSSGQGARGRGSYPTRGGPRATYTSSEPRNSGPVSSEGNVEGSENAGGFDGERLPPSRKGNQGTVRDAHTKGPRGNRPARGGASSRNVTSGGHSSYGSGHYKGGKVPAQAGERRQFERRNQNGGTDSQKKVEHGWGANTGEAELKDEVEGEKDAQTEEAQPETPAPEAAEEVATPAEPEEPEEVTKSYDDFLAERAQQALSIPGLEKKEARTVSGDLEGTAFVRSGVEEFFSGKSKNTEAKAKAPKKEKVFIEFDGTFAQPNRPPRKDNREGGEQRRGGGRGGARGGQRGGVRGGNGPRGGARGGRGGQAGINANDTNAFPALGA
uniref:Hyaluronan/mRNA-binding protein domain-containing protein n=1 Tax=Kwoniella pini CBS 10737 TaxID=1296096 RepID=A0A1B9HSH2_9TREE|nr:uncharacterized protein I206_07896 [Kwoniella pini CBS 10737]OCF46225.1 hypothetical protein I206_07896 [Kwoniella pini CBS 10737]